MLDAWRAPAQGPSMQELMEPHPAVREWMARVAQVGLNPQALDPNLGYLASVAKSLAKLHRRAPKAPIVMILKNLGFTATHCGAESCIALAIQHRRHSVP